MNLFQHKGKVMYENIEDDIADNITVSNRMMEAGKNVATHL